MAKRKNLPPSTKPGLSYIEQRQPKKAEREKVEKAEKAIHEEECTLSDERVMVKIKEYEQKIVEAEDALIIKCGTLDKEYQEKYTALEVQKKSIEDKRIEVERKETSILNREKTLEEEKVQFRESTILSTRQR